MRPPNAPRPPAWRLPAWRLAAFVGIVALAFAALTARLIFVQLVDGARYRAAAQANQIRLIPVAAPRGMIYDNHGKLMARSRPSFVVALIPSEVTDVKAELDTLAEMIGTDRNKLWARLLHHRGITYASFDEVVASEPYGPVVLVSDLPVAAVARVSEVLTALPGVDLEV